MATRSNGGSGFDDTETSFGGADAVPDTPDMPGHGTEPQQPPDGVARAIVAPAGPGIAGWAIGVVSLFVFAAYAFGVWSR